MIAITNGKILVDDKEISDELFAIMFRDASENKTIEIDLENLKINQFKKGVA